MGLASTRDFGFGEIGNEQNRTWKREDGDEGGMEDSFV